MLIEEFLSQSRSNHLRPPGGLQSPTKTAMSQLTVCPVPHRFVWSFRQSAKRRVLRRS